MLDLITKYFHDTTDYKNKFNAPATNAQIVELEYQLKIQLPIDYKEFLKTTNGFEGSIKDFIVDFASTNQIYRHTKNLCAGQFPWAVYIGTNCNLEMFVIDKRQQQFQFGLLPYIGNDQDFIALGDTFEKFIMRLYTNSAFEEI